MLILLVVIGFCFGVSAGAYITWRAAQEWVRAVQAQRDEAMECARMASDLLKVDQAMRDPSVYVVAMPTQRHYMN